MSKYISAALAVLLVAVTAALGGYAAGLFDRDEAVHVEGMDYASGGFLYSGGLINGAFDGYGKVNFADGRHYSGWFAQGRYDGEGAYTDGADPSEQAWSFFGTFQNGRLEKGTFYVQNQAVEYARDEAVVFIQGPDWQYTGGLNERGPNGTGTYTWPDGSHYTGGLQNGLAEGQGVYTNAASDTVYSGVWESGILVKRDD